MPPKLTKKEAEILHDICTRAMAYEAKYADKDVMVGVECVLKKMEECACHPANRSIFYTQGEACKTLSAQVGVDLQLHGEYSCRRNVPRHVGP